MSETPREALLNLDTLIERPQIAIDGTRYDILNPDELSVIESHRFGVWGRRIDELASKTGPDIEAELADLISTVARKICVGVPDEVFAKLPGTQRWAVIDLFTGLLLRTRLKVAGAVQSAIGPVPEDIAALTGVSSSPGSSGSTVATRPTGLKGFLRRWSGRS